MSTTTGEMRRAGNREERTSNVVSASIPQHAHAPGRDRIILENVSKFYGEVLGVNRVNL